MPRPFLRELLCSSTKALLPLQLPFRLLYKVFVSARLFSPRALFLRSPFWLGTLSRFPCSSPPSRGGRVLYVYLLTPDVLLDYLLVLDGVLAHPYLFLDHGPLLDDNLVLGHRHSNLVLTDLGLRGLPALNRYPLDTYLLMAGGYPYLLALGPDILADPNLTGFALARTGPKLFFGALYPKLFLVADAFSAAQIFFSVLAEVVFLSAFSSSCSFFVSIHACLLGCLGGVAHRAASHSNSYIYIHARQRLGLNLA